MATKKSSSKKTSGRKKSSSASGKYVEQEMHERKHGKKRESRAQAIAIGLSKARRAGEDVPPPKKGRTSAATRKKAESDSRAGQRKRTAKKSTTKKSTTKKSTTKKSAAKKTTRKSVTKKRSTRKTAAKRSR
jgi:hypothetical protein